MQQYMTALQRANQVRLARAEVRRQLHDGEITAVDVLDAVPDGLERVSIGDFLTWIPSVGDVRAGKILTDDADRPIVGRNVKLGQLSLATRKRLALRVPDETGAVAA